MNTDRTTVGHAVSVERAPFTRSEFAVYQALDERPATTRLVQDAVQRGELARHVAGKSVAQVLASLRRKGWAQKGDEGGDTVWWRADPSDPPFEPRTATCTAVVVDVTDDEVRLVVARGTDRYPPNGETVTVSWPL